MLLCFSASYREFNDPREEGRYLHRVMTDLLWVANQIQLKNTTTTTTKNVKASRAEYFCFFIFLKICFYPTSSLTLPRWPTLGQLVREEEVVMDWSLSRQLQ